MADRSVICAWCSTEMKVPSPEVGNEAYFLLPRRCRECAGHNIVELAGSIATVAKVERKRRRARTEPRAEAPTVRLTPSAVRPIARIRRVVRR
jgi:hypothetical protein